MTKQGKKKRNPTTKTQKKLTTAQKRARRKVKAENQKKFEWVFMNGKQVRIKREPTIDGMGVDEFIEKNADPIWLHQNGMHKMLHAQESGSNEIPVEDEVPFQAPLGPKL